MARQAIKIDADVMKQNCSICRIALFRGCSYFAAGMMAVAGRISFMLPVR